MCTAITYQTKDHYFGRNLDLEYSYHETVTVTPRNYPFAFRKMGVMQSHYAMIGMAYVVGGYPLYYDATNEKGVSMAGLNFPGYAFYGPEKPGKDNVAPFELIPWILGQCAELDEVRALLEKLNIAEIHFSEELPLSPLHWIIADQEGAITLEATKDGMRIYENPVGVLTNNPPFDFHMTNLVNYMGLSIRDPQNGFEGKLKLEPYSRGMGAIGLPGDLSSVSRFVRAAFTRLHSISDASESASISQFFHILGAVEQQRGCCIVHGGAYELTIYSSCCNVDRGIYYYKTYENSRISAVDMHRENLDGETTVSYPLILGQQVEFQN